MYPQQPPASSIQLTSLHLRVQEQQALFRARLFGPFQLFYANKPVDGSLWRRNKIRALLKWFLLHPDKPFSADQLVEIFWPDTPPEVAHRNLRVTIHYLRYLLEPQIERGQQSRFVLRLTNNFYLFRSDASWWVDVWEMRQQLESAKGMERLGNSARAAILYEKINKYFERGFLPEDIYEGYVHPIRRYYERLHFQVLNRLITINMKKGNFDEALEYAYQLLTLDSYSEIAMRKIIAIYHLQGNHITAIKEFRNFCALFQVELGIELNMPSEDAVLREIEEICGKDKHLSFD